MAVDGSVKTVDNEVDWLTKWRSLLQAPRALFVVYTIKLLLSFSHFSAGVVLVLWLSKELNFSDAQAGIAFGAAGLFATVFGVACGALVDRAGVRRSLAVGTALAALARVCLLKTQRSSTALFILWVLLPAADALGIPVMSIAVKRCVAKAGGDKAGLDTLAFGLFYSWQNVAALIAGLSVDALRRDRKMLVPVLALFSAPNTAYRAVFAAGALSATLATILVIFVLDDVDEGIIRTGTDISVMQAVRQVVAQHRFRRFLRLAFILLGISMIYRHLDQTLPKYMVRVFGPAAPFGSYYSIEPALVIFAVPFFGTVLKSSIYTCLVVGTIIAALSPFWLCIGKHYIFVALFVVTLSIGESIYSPKVYQYTMNVAPNGNEGVYSALGNAPLFAVNIFAGALSGGLLQWYSHSAHPQYLWAIIGCVSLTSPILLFLLREHVEERDGEEDELECASSVTDEEDGIVDEVTLSLTADANTH